MFTIQYVSIAIEVFIALIGLVIATKQKKSYGWGFFFTFLIYVFYDLTKLMSWKISYNLLYALFFMATLSALWAIISIYIEHSPMKKIVRKRRKK